MSTVTGTGLSLSYAYNGLGGRLQQTENGETTNYHLDMALGLTQVLDDGERTYLYGVNRIAQANADDDFAYFHGDALGSVRQLTDEAGDVTLAKVFTPYGDDLYEIGNAETRYGFTSEWSDVTGLVYLRARYYSPWDGRFLSQDLWSGDANLPMSYNPWLYGFDNPVMLTDPSGMLTIDFCELLPPGEDAVCREAFEPCYLSYTCTSDPPLPNWTTYQSATGNGYLFVKLLQRCDGWWHKQFYMRNEREAIKAALTLAYHWEMSFDFGGAGDELHEIVGEAYARKYWQGIFGDTVISGVTGFVNAGGKEWGGAYWLLGGRESVAKRLASHYEYDMPYGTYDGTSIRLDQRTDLQVSGEAISTVNNIFSHDTEYRGGHNITRPYEWGNPSEDWDFIDHLIGDSGIKQGYCPNDVYYIHSGGPIIEKDFCVFSFEQLECHKGDASYCDNYCSSGYP